jgi:PAS domain S-box-containing protein
VVLDPPEPGLRVRHSLAGTFASFSRADALNIIDTQGVKGDSCSADRHARTCLLEANLPWSCEQLERLAERSAIGIAFVARYAAPRRCAVWLLIVISLAHFAGATEAPAPKNILVLYSFSDRSLWDPFDELKNSIRARVPGPINFHVEYFESQRFEDPAYEKSVNETLIHVYRKEKIDLVVVGAYPALAFAIRHRDETFPGAPIVFSYVHASRFEQQKPPPGVTGVTVSADLQGTLDLALRLHPDAANVAVVTGPSEFERFWFSATRNTMMRHPTVKLVEVDGYPLPSLPSRLAALPPHTVVLFELIPLGSEQPVQGVFESLAVAGKLFPTYCIYRNYCVGRGGTIGSFPDYAEQRERTAEIVARIFSGESPDVIHVEHDAGARVYADWRELQRWKIAESALPPGSVILYRQPTVWEHYEKYIVAGLVLIVIQVLLITGLLLERARKRKAETVLRESEKRFRLMADSTPSLIWMCDKNAKITYLNERHRAFTGKGSGDGLGDSWKKYVHPDDLQKVEEATARAIETRQAFSKDYRLRRQDGTYRWMLDIASPRFNGDNSFTGFIGSAVDVTDQKLAQESLKRVSGKLIEVQDQERSRIARELHDDICQRLILLSIEIEQANQTSEKNSERERLIEVQRHCSRIAGDVQLLSHQLHSSKLDYLGIETALRSFIRDFSKRHQVKVAFMADNVPKTLPADTSLCLFRVGQEALQNARKHSGVSEFVVRLQGRGHEVRLEVSDAGAGFDNDAARKRAGLGLVSMEERVALVNGTLSIESGLNKGTRIAVSVPLVSGSQVSDTGEHMTGVENGKDDDEATSHFAGR